MSRVLKAQGHRIGGMLGALACMAALAAALPSSAQATQVVWGPITFANSSTNIGVAYGFGSTVKGRFTLIDDNSAAGDQVGGGPLCQLEFVRSGPREVDYVLYKQHCLNVPPGAKTFSFDFDVVPGPSRRIGYLYFDNGDGQFDGSPDALNFNVAYRPQLYPQDRKVRNGQKVTFVGAIPAFFFQPAPPMALQVKQGKKWRTFKLLTVQNDGSYAGVYRFTNTTQKTKYGFRVKPLSNGSYPIALSASPRAKVIVKP